MKRTLWYVIGGGITFGSVVALFLRATHSTSTPALTLIGLTPLLIIPLIALVASAWVTRSGLLRLAALGLGLVYLATFPPLDAVVGCGPKSAADTIVVYSHNVEHQHGDPAAVARQISDAEADLVVLQEVWPGFLDGLAAESSLDQLRYRASEPAAAGSHGVAVWSRWPVERAILSDVVGMPLLGMDVVSPHGTFALYDVQTTAPTATEQANAWETQLLDLATIDPDRPTVLAGDFNGTADHAQFRGLLARGWTDVHDSKGCGFDATWPRGRRLVPAILRIDHVLVSDQFEVLAVEVGGDGGSDHAAVITGIRLSEASPT